MKRSRNNSAFTIVEIVVGVIIIGILASILIPVLISQSDKAKIASAKRDLQEIANAQERAALDLGYYLRLYALDDVEGGDGIGLGGANDIVDGIADEQYNQIFANPTRMFLRTAPADQGFLNAAVADDFYRQIAFVTTPESAFRWAGPYYNIHNDETPEESDGTSLIRHLHDIPNDPWGNDYLLFTRRGVVREPEGVILDNGLASTAGYPETQVFDRPTVLSLGPNGLPGDGLPGSANYRFGKGDDLFRTFGY